MFTSQEKIILQQAAAIIEDKAKKTKVSLTNSELVKKLCAYKLVHQEHEVFAVLMLDNQHRLIEFVELFRGTINAAAVYPREVVKSVLYHNAAAVIFSHNHPAGIAEPSRSDKAITTKLINALDTIEVRVLDHIIVGLGETYSFSEEGIL